MAAQLMAKKGGSAAAAVMVDGAGDQFLARAAFPQDQHVHVLRGHAADLLADGLHGRAAADQPVGLVLGTVAVFKDHGYVHQPADGERLAHYLLKLAGIQRLDQIIVGPQFHGLDGGVGRAVPRDEDNEAPGIEPAKVMEDLQARAVAKANVQQDYIGRLFGSQLQTLGGSFGTENLDVVFCENLLDAETNARLVVNY